MAKPENASQGFSCETGKTKGEGAMSKNGIECPKDLARQPIRRIPARFVSVCAQHDVFAHGAAIAHHGGRFYATFGRNEGMENSLGEHTVCYVSDDGEAWRPHSIIGGRDRDIARSHGILFEMNGRLWAYNATYTGTVRGDVPDSAGGYYPGLRAEGYYLDDERDEWVFAGVVADDFWPLNQPDPLGNGEYIIPGTNRKWFSAYLIGSPETGWRKYDTPVDSVRYTETACLTDDRRIRLLMRNSRIEAAPNVPLPRYLACALSEDGGQSWTVGETDVFDNNSKPGAITLSNGVRCIIGNRLADQGFSRGVMTILHTAPHSEAFTELRILRDQRIPEELAALYAPQTEQAALSYPFCMEHNGGLYIIYSSSGTDGKPNHNRIELAIVRMEDL